MSLSFPLLLAQGFLVWKELGGIKGEPMLYCFSYCPPYFPQYTLKGLTMFFQGEWGGHVT